MPKRQDRYLFQGDIQIFTTRILRGELAVELVEDEQTGEELLLVGDSNHPPEPLLVADIYSLMEEPQWRWVASRVPIYPEGDDPRMYAAAALVRVRDELRSAKKVRTVPSQYDGWKTVALSSTLVTAMRKDLMARFPKLDVDRFDGRLHLLPSGKGEFADYSPRDAITINPRPEAMLDRTIAAHVGMSFVDWCLTFASREEWLATSQTPGSTDEDLLRVGVLHAAAACHDFVQMRTMLGLVSPYERQHEAAVSPDGVTVR